MSRGQTLEELRRMEGREEKPKEKMEIVRVVDRPDSGIVVKQKDSSRGKL